MRPPRPVDLRPFLTDAAVASWDGVHAVIDSVAIEHWAIAGGQMVMIHLATHRDTGHRTTADADIAVDVRAGKLAAMAEIATVLRAGGFKPELSLEGITRFTRGAARIDLLAPEDMGGDVPTNEEAERSLHRGPPRRSSAQSWWRSPGPTEPRSCAARPSSLHW